MGNELTEEQGRLVLKLEGEVDLEHSPAVRKLLLDAVARRRHVLVDLARVSYIDSSGIACLVEALQAAHKNGMALGLVAVSQRVLRVLSLARLDKVFPIHLDLATALADGA